MGIGLSAAKMCASLGMRVAIADVSEAAGKAAEEAIQREHPGSIVCFVPCDVTSDAAVTALRDFVYSDEFGGDVGFLFLNAGMSRVSIPAFVHCSISGLFTHMPAG